MVEHQEWGHLVAYYPCCTQPHQVLTRTFSYQRLCWTWPHQALTRTFCYQHTLEVQLLLGLPPLGDPIQSIPQLWNQPFWVGTHHGFVFGKKTRCPLLWLWSNRTRTNALGSTCLEYPTCSWQALWRCCMPQRVGEGSEAHLKPKSTT